MQATATALADILLAKNWRIVTVESCTGGLLAAKLTEIAGSSRWFEGGFVTYSNIAKAQMVGVDKALIDKHGAVSELVAKAMATGGVKHSQADMALSITGIAGPGGGTPDKPVGTVCFGWATSLGFCSAQTQHFQGDRNEIRLASCQFALDMAIKIATMQH